MTRKRAILDACVLYPAPLRDFLMHLALLDVFEARWTGQIHDEWIRNLLKTRPDLKLEQLVRTRELMNLHVRDCLVEGYERIIPSLELPDKDDRHVLAAAIHTKAEVILTFNLRDFPANILKQFKIAAITPDDFLAQFFETDAENICLAFERQLKSLKNPPKTRIELLKVLEAQNLPKTVAFLRN